MSKQSEKLQLQSQLRTVAAARHLRNKEEKGMGGGGE